MYDKLFFYPNLLNLIVNKRDPEWRFGKMFKRGPGLKPHWTLWVFRGSVLGRDNSEPQFSTGETLEGHE